MHGVLERGNAESRVSHKVLGAGLGGGNKYWVLPTSSGRGCLGHQPSLLTGVPDVNHLPPWPDSRLHCVPPSDPRSTFGVGEACTQTSVFVAGPSLSVYSSTASTRWRLCFKMFAETTPELPARPVALRTGFPGGARGKEPARHETRGFVPWVGKISPGGGNGNPLQCSCLENPTDRGAWWATVHGLLKSQTRRKELSPHAGMLDLSSLTWDQTCNPSEGRQSLNHWTTREVPWGRVGGGAVI